MHRKRLWGRAVETQQQSDYVQHICGTVVCSIGVLFYMHYRWGINLVDEVTIRETINLKGGFLYENPKSNQQHEKR